jgi:hypothetical protein
MYIFFQMIGLIAGIVTISAAITALEAMWRAAQGTEQVPEVRALLRNFSSAYGPGSSSKGRNKGHQLRQLALILKEELPQHD